MRVSDSRLIVLILVISLIVSNLSAFEETLLLPWGSGEGKIGQRWASSGSYGPTDFQVKDSAPNGAEGAYLYLLDREQALVQVFDLETGRFVEALPVPLGSERLVLRENKVALWDGDRLHTGMWDGELLSSALGRYPFHVVNRLLWPGDEILAIDHVARCFVIAENEKPIHLENIRSIKSPVPMATKSGSSSFTISNTSGGRIDFSYRARLGAVQYLGSGGGLHCVLTEEVLSDSPIEAGELLVLLTEGGIPHSIVPVPSVYFTWFPNRFAIYGDSLYAFVSSPRGLHLFVAGLKMPASRTLSFPHFPDEPYHFNYHLPSASQDEQGEDWRDEDPISRSNMMTIARQFVDVSWTATEDNITDEIETLPDGSQVRTPSWVTIGSKHKAPYKWGGWTSMSVFTDGVPAGKKCGDDYTSSVSWTDQYCIGVDCSGFVSRCWDTAIKYGTWTIDQTSTDLGSFSDMLRGDALNNPGSHMRLCAEDNPPGIILTMEAGAYDWRVSYRAYKLTDLSSYHPIRFDEVIEEEAISPFVVKVKDWRESLNVRKGPSINETVITTISAGQLYVSTCHHNGWYYVHIPAGTGEYGGWGYGGTTSVNGYLEGSQETRIACVTTEALNVRTSPGGSIITTISEGQRFAVLDSSGNWYELQMANTPGHLTGWSSAGSSGQYMTVGSGGPKDGYGAEVISLSYPGELDEQDSDVCQMEIRNIGGCSWDGTTLLRTTVPRERNSSFAAGAWIDSSTIKALGASVLPYQSHTFSFDLQAPLVAFDTPLVEYLGFHQDGFCWFGDGNQMGPADDEIALSITVRNIGLPPAPVIDPASVVIVSGNLLFSWNSVTGAANYGIFRGDFANGPDPAFITIVAGTTFTSPYAVGDPGINVYYQVRAYAPADSSELSTPVGEFDYQLQ